MTKNNWKLVKLGDLTLIKTGKLDANAMVEDGEYPFFTCAKQVSRIDNYKYDCECVLIAGNGDLNVKYYKGKFNAYQRTYIVESNDESKLFVKYLFHFLSIYIEKLRELSIGGVIKYIKLENLTDVKIPLPPLSIQKEIAEKLDKADALRKKDAQVLKSYEDLAQSVFIEMFGDPVKNEKGWEVKRLGEVLDFLTSGSRGWAKYYSDIGDVFLRIQNIGYNQLKINNLIYVNTPNTQEAKRTKVNSGDVILSITADLGRTAVIPNNFHDAYINQHLAILRLNKLLMNPVFVSSFIASKGGQKQFKNLDKGGVKAGLNFDDIKSYKIQIPPLPLQQKFAAIIENIEAQKAIAQQQTEESENLFQALLQESFG